MKNATSFRYATSAIRECILGFKTGVNQVYNTELKEKLEIRALAVDDHKEGRRPFFTECQEARLTEKQIEKEAKVHP